MATNPMQRKARNSFLLGMLVMLLIAGLIIAFLFIQLMNKTKKEQEELKASVDVYVLSQDVKSGQVITTDMLDKQTVNRNLVPSNATSDISIIEDYALQDKEGNDVYTKVENNEPVLYIRRDNKEQKLQKEEETDNYYIERSNEKEYIELNSVPLIAKVDMNANTVITTDLITKSDNPTTDDLREQEYNMLVLPVDLQTGDYIDIRVQFPSGQDFIVVSKKEVEIPEIAGTDSPDTIRVDLTEDEILHMSCAIVESYRVNGSKLYVTKYTEAGMQAESTPTFPVNRETSELISNNPNIVERIKQEINARYNNNGSINIRNNYINPTINETGEEGNTNLRTKMDESITNAQNSRREYLESLAGETTATTTTEE